MNIEDTSSPQPTPEASFDSNATKIIIHKSDEKINTFGKNSSKDFDSGERSALADGKKVTSSDEAVKNVTRRAYNLKAIKIEPAGGQFRIKKSSSAVPVTDSMYSIADLYEFGKAYEI